MMTILITGANGQLGNELLRLLSGERVTVGETPAAYRSARIVGVDVDQLDITDPRAVSDFVSALQPDILFNCAAMTNVNGCEGDAALAMRVNADGVRNLAQAMEAVGGKMVHVSTDYVFSGTAQTPYTEEDLPDPKTVYGSSKLLGERYLQQCCSRSFIFRTAWLYGQRGNNFVKTMQRLVSEKPAVHVVNDQRGNPTNAADLAYHMLAVAITEEYGLYHCTGEGICSWYEFACEIARLSHLPVEKLHPCTTAEYPTPAARPAYSALENRRLARTVGNRMRFWKDALAEFLSEPEAASSLR